MKLRPLVSTMLASSMLLAGMTASADDGEQTLKRMTGGSIDNQLTVLPEDVGLHVSEAEHAFTDTMKFYVPSQAASGLVGPVDYNNVDLTPVETLAVAKPLVNVFIYGPASEVPGTAFAHSFMDAFAAVSLDDGVTWKTTNLSQSADQSSFEIGQNTGGGGGGGHEGSAPTLVLESAVWSDLKNNKNFGKLAVVGTADPLDKVQIVNYTTGDVLFETLAKKTTGSFTAEKNVRIADAPCMVQAVVDGVYSNPLTVEYPEGTTVDCSGVDLTEYPGGVYNVVHATDGNKVLVAWPSRFCQQGQPAYSFAYDADAAEDSEKAAQRAAIASYIGTDVTKDLYLADLFEVGGSQGSINFADEGYPQAGEVPFGCVWTVRGVLLPGDDPRTGDMESSHMVWTKPERLTSGRRDPNRIEVQGVKGAGFVITWQEDPDGLRPGQGEGPGEGWSGAVAHDKTDVWYSFIPWQYFDVVESVDENGVTVPINIVDHVLGNQDTGADGGRPQVYVPMAVPMRLTNNDKCVPENTGITDPADPKYFSYCNYVAAAAYGLQNFCADTVSVPQGQSGAEGLICVNEDGLPNVANTGSTRPRLSLQGYSSRNNGIIDSAWVIVAAEESKGLGRFGFMPDGTPCDPDDDAADPACSADVGKNQWYFSFDMGDPATSATATEPNGLVQNLVNQGNLLNQPEVDWRTGEFYPVINTVSMWDFSGSTNGNDYNFNLYNTEIARRSSLLVQGIAKAKNSSSGLLATPSWKQGAMNQGGPADAMLRRIVLPAGYVDGIANNPYAFTNMACSDWLVAPGENPYYPDGVCGEPATNLSSVVPDTCVDTNPSDTSGQEPPAAIPCPSVDFTTSSTFGIGDTNPILQGFIQQEGNTQKVLTWHQCPSDGTQLSGDFAAVTCDTDNRTDAYVNLKDQSWYNPLDVSKGHRGFIDGDFVMFLYAWSPNWRLNAKGNDRYDLYVRRSFDGGQTWQTTPSSFAASDGNSYPGDGTVTCETYRSEETQAQGETAEPQVCYQYVAGGNEQARNVTQHQRMRVTTLDPRFAMTGSPRGVSITTGCVDATDPTIDTAVMTCDDTSAMDSDLRNPSRYFIVYETGDNTTVTDGEAEPLDLFYSRAESFGDDYVVWAETDTSAADATVCYPNDPHGDEGITEVVAESGFCNEFDRLNAGGDTHSSEADLEANPGGSKLYAAWAQWVFENDDYEADIVESDAMARRLWWIDDYISTNPDNVWTLPGTSQQGTGTGQ